LQHTTHRLPGKGIHKPSLHDFVRQSRERPAGLPLRGGGTGDGNQVGGLCIHELPPPAWAGSFMQRPKRLFHKTLACAFTRGAADVESPGTRLIAEPLVSLE